MTTLADTRPPGLDLIFRAGNALTVELTWPAGSLTGRTFTSTLGAASLGVAINGDVMTITATAAQTAAVTASSAVWVLTETTAGASDDVIVGIWAPSDDPNAVVSTSLTVTFGTVEGNVTVVSGVTQAALNAKVSKSGDTMTGSLVISGATSDLSVGRDLIVTGRVATQHDAIYWFPSDVVSEGSRTTSAGSATGIDRITFDSTTSERLRFTWVPPLQWLGRDFTVRVGWLKEVAGSGNVVWQYAHHLSYLGGNFTTTPVASSSVTRAVPVGGALAAWDYFDLATFNVPLGGFGEMPFIAAEVRRLPADAADTFTAGDVSIFSVTATAEPL